MSINHFKKFYLIGNPVGHSLSPIMQQLFLNYYKIEGSYEAIEVQPDDLESTIYRLGEQGAAGVNVTVPYKESVMNLMDELSEEAALIGSVNTIKFQYGGLYGYNTDLSGFEQSLPVPIENTTVVMLGAGGVARSILIALGKGRCHEIAVFNRTRSRAEGLIENLAPHYPSTQMRAEPWDVDALKNTLSAVDILINTTSVGMKTSDADNPLVESDWLHKNLFVYDVIYNPLETPLIKQAAAKGLQYINGLDMLIYQGLEALRIWLGEDLPFADSLINKARELLTQKLQTGTNEH